MSYQCYSELNNLIFEQYKLLKPNGSLDINEAQKVAMEIIKDTEWLSAKQSALEVCGGLYADEHMVTYQKAMKFTKEECNAKYTSLFNCLEIYGFRVSY